MADILLFDTRVIQADSVPGFQLTKRITASDSLPNKINELLHDIETNINTAVPSYFNYLHILCHGTERGLQLGAPPGLDQNNTLIFSPLINKVGHIVIHGCSAAYVYPHGNNGRLMCQRLARAVNAIVTASDATQFVLPGSSVVNSSDRTNLVAWQGNVGQWGSNNNDPNANPNHVSSPDDRQNGQPLVY
jgi:hypothetical protein